MLSVTLAMGTTATDFHSKDAEEIACMSADAEAYHGGVLGDSEKDDEHQTMHMHHSHSCGPCHLHMVDMNGPTFSYASTDSRAFRLGANEQIPLTGPHGLFRPPRA